MPPLMDEGDLGKTGRFEKGDAKRPRTVEKSPWRSPASPQGGGGAAWTTIWAGHEGPCTFGFAIALTLPDISAGTKPLLGNRSP